MRLQVRLRIDGMLKNVPAPPMSMAKGILSRLKILASPNITERRLAQDGRAHIVVGGSEIDLRVATMPTMHGEMRRHSPVAQGSRPGHRSTRSASARVTRDLAQGVAGTVRHGDRHRTDRIGQDDDACGARPRDQ